MSVVLIRICEEAKFILPWTIIEWNSEGCTFLALDLYEGVKSLKFDFEYRKFDI